MNRRAPYTQADVKRAAKGALDAGLKVLEVVATADGVRIICDTGTQKKPNDKPSWDDLIEQWPENETHTPA